ELRDVCGIGQPADPSAERLVETEPREDRQWAALSTEGRGIALGRLGVGGLDPGPLGFRLSLADGGEPGQLVTVRAAGDETVGGRLWLLGCLGAEEALHRVGESRVFVASLCPLRGEVEP